MRPCLVYFIFLRPQAISCEHNDALCLSDRKPHPRSGNGDSILRDSLVLECFCLDLLSVLFHAREHMRLICVLVFALLSNLHGKFKYSGPSNFERFDVRTTWNSNKNFEENPVLKLEQKLESGTNSHVVVTWSPSLSAWSHAQLLGQFSRDGFSEHLANSVCFLSLLFISLSYFYIIFNNTHS
jgi:hypothetical protein